MGGGDPPGYKYYSDFYDDPIDSTRIQEKPNPFASLMNNNPNPNPNQLPGANAPQGLGNNPLVITGNGFTNQNGVYIIQDPTLRARQGYLNPMTLAPYHNQSYQPYATNLANAMAHDVQVHNRGSCLQMSRDSFSASEHRFFTEFIQSKHPGRNPNQYWNSAAIRSELKALP